MIWGSGGRFGNADAISVTLVLNAMYPGFRVEYQMSGSAAIDTVRLDDLRK